MSKRKESQHPEQPASKRQVRGGEPLVFPLPPCDHEKGNADDNEENEENAKVSEPKMHDTLTELLDDSEENDDQEENAKVEPKIHDMFVVSIRALEQCANDMFFPAMEIMKIEMEPARKLDALFLTRDSPAHCRSCTCFGRDLDSMKVAVAHMFGVSKTGQISIEAADIYAKRDGSVSVGGGGGGNIQAEYWIPAERKTGKYHSVVSHYLSDMWEEITGRRLFEDKTKHPDDLICSYMKPCPIEITRGTKEGGGFTSHGPPDLRCPICHAESHLVWRSTQEQNDE